MIRPPRSVRVIGGRNAPDPAGAEGQLTARRFMDRVSPEPTTGCWLWTGAMDGRGYGAIRIHGVTVKATHLSLLLDGRSVGAGQVVRHRCDFPACVNPDHLLAGTQAENAGDKCSRGRARGAAKLTEEQAREALRLMRAGSPPRDLAARYGVTAGALWYLRSGKSWARLQAPGSRQ